MHWLLVTDDYPPQRGGVSTWTYAVARGLREAGDQVTVAARAREDRTDPSVVQVKGPSFGWLGPHWIRWATKGVRPDRVLATTWNVASGLLPRLEREGWPLDVAFHGGDLNHAQRDPNRFHRVVMRADRRFVGSHWMFRRLRRFGYTGELLPAPVDLRDPGGSPLGPWGFLGRAVRSKAVDRILSMAAVAGRPVEILGDGPELNTYTALARQLGVHLVTPGAVGPEQVAQRMRQWQACFLLPRPDPEGGEEGLGLSLLEAAAVGVPVVGCRTGGVPEAVGPAGLLLEHPDDPKLSVAAFEQWYTPNRGAEARAWLARTHGTRRLVEALRRVE